MIKVFLLLFLLSSCGKPIVEKGHEPSALNRYQAGVSEEILLDTRMSFNFDLLPLKGTVRKSGKYWSGDSWRLFFGAINYRWNSPRKETFNYLSPSRREVLSYTEDDLRALSPAEKYDILMGRYDYPLKYEVDQLARKGQEDWEGLCHGWAGASMNHEEPAPKKIQSADGVTIPFGSSDIKALLTYAYSKLLIRDDESLGKRCEDPSDEEADYCRNDLSAETFHVVLANKIGLRGQGIIADVDRYKEVWNHPLVSFESTILKFVSTSTGKLARLSTRVSYVDVSHKNSWEKHPAVMSYMTFRYELEIDKAGNITKGKWLSKERPDFLWTIQRAEKFEGYLSGIMDLLK